MIKMHRDAQMFLFHLERHIRMCLLTLLFCGNGWGVYDCSIFIVQPKKGKLGFILHDTSKYCDNLLGVVVGQDSEDICILCGK